MSCWTFYSSNAEKDLVKSILIKWVNESNKEAPERKERLLRFETTPALISPARSTQRSPPKMSISHQDKRPRWSFFQRIHTIRRTQRGMAWTLSLFWPHELGVPSPQIKKRAVDNWSVNMPEERVLNVSPCALSPPGPIPGPDNNTAASRHRGLALTINAMNKSHKRVGNALYWVRQSPVLPFKDSFYVGIRLLLMKFKLIRGNQKPPIRLQIDFLVICHVPA